MVAEANAVPTYGAFRVALLWFEALMVTYWGILITLCLIFSMCVGNTAQMLCRALLSRSKHRKRSKAVDISRVLVLLLLVFFGLGMYQFPVSVPITTMLTLRFQ